MGGKFDGVSTRSQRQGNLDSASKSKRFSGGSNSFSAAAISRDNESNLLGKIDHLQSTIDALEKRLASKMDCVIGHLNKSIDELQSCVVKLKEKCNGLQQENENLLRQSRLNEVVIRGIPHTVDEEPKSILSKVSEIIGHNLSPYATVSRIKTRLKKAHQLSQSSAGNVENNRHLPLLVRFSCINEKKSFCSLFYKRKGMKLNELDGFTTESRIYVNDNLTPTNGRILYNALKLFKCNKIASVFTLNGSVYIKCTGVDNSIKVNSLGQLSSLVCGQ